MNKFDKKVRWNFRLAMHGYGQNVSQALKSALELALYELENHSLDLTAIETHEVTSIDEAEIEDEDDGLS